MDKAPDAFRTISEVAEDLDVPQHVLRFWETRFAHIRPLKRGGGRRYYRPDDVDLLRGIRHLLYGEGYTIRGVQRILKDNGPRFVQAVWRSGAPQPPRARADDAEPESAAAFEESSPERPTGAAQATVREPFGAADGAAPGIVAFADAGAELPSGVDGDGDPIEVAPAPVAEASESASRAREDVPRPVAQASPSVTPYVPGQHGGAAFARSAASAGSRAQNVPKPQRSLGSPSVGSASVVNDRALAEAEAAERQLIERLAMDRRTAERPRAAETPAEGEAATQRDAARESNSRARSERLRAALAELEECRRLLEAARKDEP